LKTRIAIIGGGSQAHILAGFLGSQENVSINILTRRPKDWGKIFTTFDLSDKQYTAELGIISDKPEDVIPQSDLIFFCLPGFAVKEQLIRIRPFVTNNHILGSAFSGTGFFFDVLELFGADVRCFGFQRVPFTGRVKEYGKSATLKGYKPFLAVAHLNCNEEYLAEQLSELFKVEVRLLNNILEATLSNSNPILHPSRLYVLYKDWYDQKLYDKEELFYENWDDESSKLWIACDGELQAITQTFETPVNIETVLSYYGCKDYRSLTTKLRSIKPFMGVKTPMIKVDNGFILNGAYRYFTEDIPYGLVIIKSIAEQTGIETPHINQLIEWGQKVMHKEYIINGKLTGKDISLSGYVNADVFQMALCSVDKKLNLNRKKNDKRATF